MLKKIWVDLYCGISFFSRLPVQWMYKTDLPFSFGRAIWAWPLVSLLLASVISIFYYSAFLFIPSPWIVAFLTVGFQLFLTGGLHEDGLADMADGFGGGKNREHKLTIMRDSHLGTYGILTLFITLGLQVSALSFLTQHIRQAIPILIITAILSRVSMLFPICYSKPARSDGIASTLKTIPYYAIIIALTFTTIILFICVSWDAVIQYSIMSAIVAFIITILAHKHIQGYTGDILGAIQVLTTTILLLMSTILID